MDLVRRLARATRRLDGDQRGLSTIAALVVIWGVLEALGVEVVEWIRSQILGSA
jgi:hypothetical protein